MYKRVLIFVAALVFTLSSCSKPPVTKEEIAEKYSKGFEAEFKADFFGKELSAEIEKEGEEFVLTVYAPEALAGVSAETEDGGKISFSGMETDMDIKLLPEKSPIAEIFRLFRSLSAPENFEIAESGDEVRVTAEGMSAVLERENLSVKSAAFDKSGRVFCFTGFEFRE